MKQKLLSVVLHSFLLGVVILTIMPATLTAQTQNTWVGGSNVTTTTSGVYGTKGTAAASNIPGARYTSVSWTDASGNLWLFGGYAYPASGGGTLSYMNDLWKFNTSTKQWTWINGSNSSTAANQLGVYGTKGTAAAANTPGGRQSAVAWTDASGNFWLFGGSGYAASGGSGLLNDLWKYNPTTNQWTWVSGSNLINQFGNYGAPGTAKTDSVPGGRQQGVSWTDASGNFWLFAGTGYSASASGVLNDLWKYNTTTNQWTWVSGSSATTQTGTYGTQGVAAAGNKPGARVQAVSWADAAGNLWLFGGSATIGGVAFNDLWKYNTATSQWTWMAGSSSTNQSGVYGTQGTPAAGNKPGGRTRSTGWIDGSGNFWLFGGVGYAVSGSGDLNDLWKYNPSINQWAWIGGSNTANQISTYGTQGAASTGNIPGGRYASASWVDASGNFWLFAGYGYASTTAVGYLQELWEIDPYNTWLGSSTTWSTTGNWSYNSIPTSTDQVMIPQQSNQPVIGSGVAAVAGNITIKSGAIVTINGTGTLTAGNGITVNPGASLAGNSSNVTGTVTLQQTITDQRGWRVLANPFSTATNIATTATTNRIAIGTSVPASGLADSRTYDNNSNAWANVTGTTWDANIPYALFIRGVNGEVSGASYLAGPFAFTYSVSGTLNGASTTVTPGTASNFLLVGNPYAAPVTTSSLTNGTGKSYYVYQISQGADQPAQQTKAGSWSAVLSSGTTTTIPVLGAIAYQPATTTSYTITSTDIKTNGTPQTGIFGAAEIIKNLELVVNNKSGGYEDKLFVRIGELSSNLSKLSNDNVNVYTINNNEHLAIDARKELNTTIPFGISAVAGSYSFNVANNNLDNTTVYLKDNLLNTQTALQPGVNYSFTISSDATTQAEQRFELVFGTNTPVVTITPSNTFTARLLGNPINNTQAVKVEITGSAHAIIRVTDINGKTIATQNAVNGINHIPVAGVLKGVYMVQVTDGAAAIVNKLVIE